MKKEYIVGGLAIVGAVALFVYLKPKKKANSEGFYGANGKMSSSNLRVAKSCAWCKSSDGGLYYVGNTGRKCEAGDRCNTPYA